ncbi:hypothetical protein [Rhizobacter sp. Root1221]|uniref:hypothetical protein n=1 Tax=Rhizobacter sp. Root1221 TaxID=1736433 RepID=UPI000715F83B|nr:hypothetical protein [Rhizobacter sp. Root1221]KQV81292.1 hypothetical protein ASC87_10230 [Rhizobacter sp. Root1221]
MIQVEGLAAPWLRQHLPSRRPHRRPTKSLPHGGDWWLAAVLDVPATALPSFLPGDAAPATFDIPPGLALASSFATLKALPGARSSPDGRLRVTANVHGVGPYASSPLLHGHTMPLSATQVLVVLWTH